MTSTDKTGAPSKRTALRRHSSSFLAQLRAAGSRSPRSSQETLPTSPGLIAADSIYSNSVHYRLSHMLVSRPPNSRIPTTERPTRQCLVGYGPVLGVYMNLSVPPKELSIRFMDDNSQVFTGTEHTSFAKDLETLQTKLDERFEVRLKSCRPLDTFLSQDIHRDRRARLHQALHQIDFMEFHESLQPPSEKVEGRDWRLFQSIQIDQLPDRDTFNAMKGNRLLPSLVKYEPPRDPAEIMNSLERFMATDLRKSRA